MNAWIKHRAVLLTVATVLGVIGFVGFRILSRDHARRRPAAATALVAPVPVPAASATPLSPDAKSERKSVRADAAPTRVPASMAENAAYLGHLYALDKHARDDLDAQGVPLTRRETPRAEHFTGSTADDSVTNAPPTRSTLRLLGRPRAPHATSVATSALPVAAEPTIRRAAIASDPTSAPAPSTNPSRTRRFNPYGSVIKCELVFTLDSANEQTPLVSVVMEPVYNNGMLVIPAGAELHGVARPDRLRDRIVSGSEWVLVFPREPGRLNGRQLNVRGVALDRVEPDANGMTWGLTDGSYGLEGTVIRTMKDAEIKRFIATFLAAGTEGLQQRQSGGRDRDTVRSTPQNAVLQGIAANFTQIATEIGAEIQANGVFIRVPAGHQFYFYPMQLIDPDVAAISGDVANVK